MKRMIQGLLLAGSLVVGGTALAQGTMQGTPQGGTQGQTMKDPAAKLGKGMAKGGMIEHMGFMMPADEKAMLERLHHVNQMEIQLGRLAQQNGMSQDVKTYGDTLVRDHTSADQKLMTYAQQKGHKLAEPKPLNEVERKSMAAHKASMEKLQVLKGQPFDACFLASMVGDHDEVLGKLMAAQQNDTAAAVTPLLQQHAQAVTQHRQQAYTLLGRIGPGSSSGVGGSGDMHPGHDMGKGTGGAGDVNKGSQGIDEKNTMDPGSKKKF
jgi:putative membrane protein